MRATSQPGHDDDDDIETTTANIYSVLTVGQALGHVLYFHYIVQPSQHTQEILSKKPQFRVVEPRMFLPDHKFLPSPESLAQPSPPSGSFLPFPSSLPPSPATFPLSFWMRAFWFFLGTLGNVVAHLACSSIECCSVLCLWLRYLKGRGSPPFCPQYMAGCREILCGQNLTQV